MKPVIRKLITWLAVAAVLAAAFAVVFVVAPLRESGDQLVPDEALLTIPGVTEQFVPLEGTVPQDCEGMSIAAQNERFQLLIDVKTAEIALVDLDNGEIWRSNPADRENDVYAKGDNAEKLASQLIIRCFDSAEREHIYNTFAGSVESGQYAIRTVDDGIKVDYVIGKRWDDDAGLPRIISRARFEGEILDKLESDSDRRIFTDNYYGIRFTVLPEDAERPGITNFDQEAVFGEWGIQLLDEKKGTSVLREAAAQWTLMVAEDKGLSSRAELSAEDFLSFRDAEFYVRKGEISRFDQNDMLALLEGLGYTLEDARADTAGMGMNPPTENRDLYRVTVEYRLGGDSLTARIPLKEIYYPVKPSAAAQKALKKEKKALEATASELEKERARVLEDPNSTEQERENAKAAVLEQTVKIQDIDAKLAVRTAPIVEITLLPFFAAAGETQEGYMLVPDGSGALIRLNGGKAGASPYLKTLYGEDGANADTERKVQDVEQAYLPVFGMKAGQTAMFAVIEGGAAYAAVQADVSGRSSGYNTVGALFRVIPYGTTELRGTPTFSNGAMADSNTRNVYQLRTFEEDVCVRYRFLYGDEADYSHMAALYRQDLIEKYGLQKLSPSSELPLYLEAVASVEAQEDFLGFKTRRVSVLTDAGQLADMVTQLQEAGLQNLQVKYSGCFGGGVNQNTVTSTAFQKGIGSAKDIAHVQQLLQDKGGQLYLSYNLVELYESERYAAIGLDRTEARRYPFDLVTGLVDKQHYFGVVSPGRYAQLMEKATEKLAGSGFTALCFEGLGDQLNSDFSSDALIDRSQTIRSIDTLLAQRSSEGLTMLDGGNIYAAVYADALTGVPAEATPYHLIDESIPFYQMVLHGYIPYAGTPVNQSEDKETMLLQMAETGSALSFQLAASGDAAGSNAEDLFGMEFAFWKDDLLTMYRELNAVLAAVQGEEMVSHTRPADGIAVTVYADGTAVAVNYTQTDYHCNGQTVAARSFAVLEEGAP